MYFLYFNTCTAENALLCEVTKQISDMTQNELLDMYHFAIHIKSKRLLLPMETWFEIRAAMLGQEAVLKSGPTRNQSEYMAGISARIGLNQSFQSYLYLYDFAFIFWEYIHTLFMHAKLLYRTQIKYKLSPKTYT